MKPVWFVGACSSPNTGRPGIALPPGSALPSGGNKTENFNKKRSENVNEQHLKYYMFFLLSHTTSYDSKTTLCALRSTVVAMAKGQNAYSTLDSQAVSDPSTKRAQRCLTWLIGREAVFSTWYGRKRERRQCNAKTIHRSCERVV